jgi:ferredoxin
LIQRKSPGQYRDRAVCVEVCPLVFSLNDAGYIKVAELSDYPESCVEEAIKYCPEDCISWEEG